MLSDERKRIHLIIQFMDIFVDHQQIYPLTKNDLMKYLYAKIGTSIPDVDMKISIK